MSDHTHKIFTSTNCISEQTMFDYIDNKLSAKERHMTEKHLLDCQLCSDALEGLELIRNRDRIRVINQKVNEYIAPANEKRIIGINYRTVAAIAAGLVLLIGSVFFFNQIAPDKLLEEKNMADVKHPSSSSPITIEKKILEDSLTEEMGSETKNNISPSAEKLEPAKKSTENEKIITTTSTASASTMAPEQLNNDDERTITLEEKSEKQDLLKKENEPITTPAPVTSGNAEGKAKAKNTETETMAPSRAKNKRLAPSTTDTPKEPVNIDYELLSIGSNSPYKDVMKDSIYSVVEEMPKFPGGEAELIKFIQQNIQFAKTDDQGNSYETITIQFIIGPTGKAIKPQLLQPQSKEMEKQLIELVNKMPSWNPGKQNGKTVSVRYTLPVKAKHK